MTDDNGLYYMRARYYNVNIKRFINQDVVHGSINVSQSLNRYSYVQGNPIKLTDPFGLSPLDRLNWKNLGHAILNGLGLIPVIGEAFDIANAIWYAHDGEYGMAVLSMMSALPMIGNIASGIMTAAKITTAAKIVSTVCKVVSNAATFTQAAIGGVNNAKAIVKNMINGKLFSEDTAKNLVSFGINAFTAATSGKNLLSSSKELKKVVGDSVGSKWGKKAKKEPLLECNLQFFAEKSGCESGSNIHVPSANTQVVRHPEIKSPNQVKMNDVTNYWDDYLGSNQTNIHPRTGLVDNDRIFSADGTKSIRFGNHEMDSMGTTKFHFHLEEWKYDPVNDVMEYFNTLVRIKK